MGQSQSNQPSVRFNRQSSLRRSFKRVYSEQPADVRCSASRSLPGSPAVHKKLMECSSSSSSSSSSSPTSAPTSPRMPFIFESVLKNFEEFAQHQWPTWAKRRGWVAEFAEPASSSSSSSPASASSSESCSSSDDCGQVTQLESDKWVFHRKRKSTALMPPVLELEKTEVGPEPDTRPLDDPVDKCADVLHVEDNIQQPRSRRSSGYASASSSPLNKRLATANKERRSVVIDEDDDTWRMSLYEVTLRWMFDLDGDGDAPPVVNNDAPSVQIDEATPPKPIGGGGGDVLANDQRQVIRIYLHLFGKNRSKLPLHIDLEPLLSAADSSALWYAIVAPDDANHANPLSREITCADLIDQIVASHPTLQCEVGKLALYEKTWWAGKTSRARLRRLNDTESPLILARQWKDAKDSQYAKTLVFQQVQNGDIPWEDFTLAELSSFLRVLDREEAHHELEIRKKYQRMNQCLVESLRKLDCSAACHDDDDTL